MLWYSWSFNPDRNRFDFIELSARLNYPCVHLRWDVSTYSFYLYEDMTDFAPRFRSTIHIGQRTAGNIPPLSGNSVI